MQKNNCKPDQAAVNPYQQARRIYFNAVLGQEYEVTKTVRLCLNVIHQRHKQREFKSKTINGKIILWVKS
jgi:hypothetical protein